MVQYPLIALVGIPDSLGTITEELKATLQQLEQNLSQDVSGSGKFLRLLHARVEFLNETLTLALENYHSFPLSHHQKRGFIDGIGHLSRMLFETAMNEDVEELRDRYNHLALLASANNKAIHFNSKHIARLEQHMNDIASYAANL